MTKSTFPLLLCTAITLTGCATISQSRLNPLNWFGPSTAVITTAPQAVRPLLPEGAQIGPRDARGLIDTVTEMRVDSTPFGAIVRATGVAAVQGQYNAQLVPAGFENGTLTLAFRVETSPNAATGTPQSRAITVARAFDFDALAGVRTIVVQAASGARSASR